MTPTSRHWRRTPTRRAPSRALVLLAGEAGVGKTALLEAFKEQLPDATWAWGSCDVLFTRDR